MTYLAGRERLAIVAHAHLMTNPSGRDSRSKGPRECCWVRSEALLSLAVDDVTMIINTVN
jgi:hypothetical protein